MSGSVTSDLSRGTGCCDRSASGISYPNLCGGHGTASPEKLVSVAAALLRKAYSMASVSKDTKSNAYRLSFYGLDKKKKSVWLGDFTKKMAETAQTNVEHLLAAKAAGVPP